MSKCLLIIDPQNDFVINDDAMQRTSGSRVGTLAVDGAYDDCVRLSKFINDNTNDIDQIIITQDTHHVYDISHPSFWIDKTGKNPAPFTTITLKNINDGDWNPVFNPNVCINYIKQLEANGEFVHTIWPEHCINGSWGAAIVDVVMDSVKEWCRKRRKIHTIQQKGEYLFTEHFGALRANVPDLSQPSTTVNQQFINQLLKNDVVYIAGEAKSHCVANTLKQLMDEAPVLVDKIVILENCMSNVGGVEWKAATDIFDRAKASGVKFINV